MPQVELDTLPDESRAWVFAAADTLSDEAVALLLRDVDAFLDAWRAHGVPLHGARELREARFLCIAVDQRAAGASGCSVDGLFRQLRELEPQLGTSLIAGGLVFWRGDEGVVRAATRPQFAAHAVAGQVASHTPVFDVSITSLADWRHNFERAAGASWHARLLGSVSG